MKRSAMVVVVTLLFAGAAAAQSGSEPVHNASAARADQSPALPAGAPIEAVLSKTLDSHKLKPGDSVMAETTESTEDNGKTIIPRGTKLEGHVVQASARSKGDTYSSLAIVFDKAVLKHGEQIPLNVTVQAMAAPVNTMPPSNNNSDMSAAAPPQVPGESLPNSPNRTMGGVPPAGMAPTANPDAAANTNVGNAMDGTGAVGGTNSSGRLTANSRGVFGLKGIGLTGSTTRSQQTASVITSTGKNVHLDSGTQLLLVTQTPTAAPKS
jgi:hypothetical protein